MKSACWISALWIGKMRLSFLEFSTGTLGDAESSTRRWAWHVTCQFSNSLVYPTILPPGSFWSSSAPECRRSNKTRALFTPVSNYPDEYPGTGLDRSRSAQFEGRDKLQRTDKAPVGRSSTAATAVVTNCLPNARDEDGPAPTTTTTAIFVGSHIRIRTCNSMHSSHGTERSAPTCKSRSRLFGAFTR